MMLLCPFHHDQATKGALTIAQQRESQRAPFNIRAGRATGQLVVNSPVFAIQTGSVYLVGDGPLIVVGSRPLLSLEVGEDGEVQISVTLHGPDDEPIAEIDRNEWLSGDPLPWDIVSDHQRLTIRLAARKIALDLNVRSLPMALTAQLWCDRHLVRLDRRGIWFDEMSRPIGFQHIGLVGFCLIASERGVQMSARASGGMLVSDANPLVRLTKSLRAWTALNSGRGSRPSILQ
jgi:hypothetical protein